jgi:hypothetical protein
MLYITLSNDTKCNQSGYFLALFCDLKRIHEQKDAVYALLMKKQNITILLFPNLVTGLYTFLR